MHTVIGAHLQAPAPSSPEGCACLATSEMMGCLVCSYTFKGTKRVLFIKVFSIGRMLYLLILSLCAVVWESERDGGKQGRVRESERDGGKQGRVRERVRETEGSREAGEDERESERDGGKQGRVRERVRETEGSRGE